MKLARSLWTTFLREKKATLRSFVSKTATCVDLSPNKEILHKIFCLYLLTNGSAFPVLHFRFSRRAGATVSQHFRCVCVCVCVCMCVCVWCVVLGLVWFLLLLFVFLFVCLFVCLFVWNGEQLCQGYALSSVVSATCVTVGTLCHRDKKI